MVVRGLAQGHSVLCGGARVLEFPIGLGPISLDDIQCRTCWTILDIVLSP